jgi:hypothetical protein
VLSVACPSQRYWSQNVTLSFNRTQLLTPITDSLSIIRYDFSDAVIHTYWHGIISRFDAKTFRRMDPIIVGIIDDFHVGGGRIFTSVGGNVTAYDQEGNHSLIFKRPDTESADVGVYYVLNNANSDFAAKYWKYPVLEFAFFAAITGLFVVLYCWIQWVCCLGSISEGWTTMESIRRDNERWRRGEGEAERGEVVRAGRKK